MWEMFFHPPAPLFGYSIVFFPVCTSMSPNPLLSYPNPTRYAPTMLSCCSYNSRPRPAGTLHQHTPNQQVQSHGSVSLRRCFKADGVAATRYRRCYVGITKLVWRVIRLIVSKTFLTVSYFPFIVTVVLLNYATSRVIQFFCCFPRTLGWSPMSFHTLN
jgi:hypothetical protein